MIIVELIGGLGNQMFQYAMGKYLAQKHNTELKLDISGFDDYKLHKYQLTVFNISENSASQEDVNKLKYKKPSLWSKVTKRKKAKFAESYFQERVFHFDPGVLGLPDNTYIQGYWQSEKYFKDIEGVLKKDFTLKNELNEKNKQMLELISSKNAVSLHVRRGDYVANPNTNNVHGTCSLEYYKKAIDYIVEHVESPHFFLLSDDIDWVKINLKINMPTTYVDINGKDEGYLDINLMSSCQHHIIANSSFSWWGAWLGHNSSKIIIAPKKWFNNALHNTQDIMPDNWVKL